MGDCRFNREDTGIKGVIMKKGEIKQIIRTSIVRYIRVSKVKR